MADEADVADKLTEAVKVEAYKANNAKANEANVAIWPMKSRLM